MEGFVFFAHNVGIVKLFLKLEQEVKSYLCSPTEQKHSWNLATVVDTFVWTFFPFPFLPFIQHGPQKVLRFLFSVQLICLSLYY